MKLSATKAFIISRDSDITKERDEESVVKPGLKTVQKRPPLLVLYFFMYYGDNYMYDNSIYIPVRMWRNTWRNLYHSAD